MSHKLKAYPKYRDSGLQWLGIIPAKWRVKRNGQIFAQRIETGFSDLPILEVSLKTGIRVRDLNNLNHKQVMSNREKYKLAAQGDIVYNMMRMWQGAVGIVPVDGLVSPAYVVVCPFSETESRYYSYLFRTASYAAEVNKYSHGIVADRNRLYWEEFKQMPSAFPPKEEQIIIADFLDRYTYAVRHFINAKRHLIRLLEEQKQAIIHRAVTRGLDPSVPLKPSGVEWLGDVPEHWSIVSAKQVSRIFIPQRDKPKLNEEIGLQWITPECIGFRNAILSGNLVSPHAAKEAGCRSVPSGSVIASCIGRFGISSINQDPVYINQQLQAYIPTSAIDARYLRYIIKISKSYFEMNGNSTTLAYVNRQGFSDLPLILPPISIQETIVSSLERFESLLDLIIQRTNNQISLLREYRARLISDVVTGKLDVRGVNLPAAEDIEAPEEYTDFLESEEIIEEDLQEEIPAEGDLDEQ